MKDFDIEIRGTKPPRGPGRLQRLLARIRHTVGAYLRSPGWLALSMIVGFVLVVGMPYVGWEYDCRYEDRVGRCQIYGSCDYYGVFGKTVLYGDECGGLITFIRPGWLPF